MHTYRRATVAVESGSVTVCINDEDNTNEVRSNEDARGKYSIRRISEKDRYQKVEYRGVADGNAVLMGVKNDMLELEAATAKDLKVNGVEILLNPNKNRQKVNSMSIMT